MGVTLETTSPLCPLIPAGTAIRTNRSGGDTSLVINPTASMANLSKATVVMEMKVDPKFGFPSRIAITLPITMERIPKTAMQISR